MAVVTYSLLEKVNPEVDKYSVASVADTLDIVRIIDRNSCIVSTNYGCVYVARCEAAHMLREARRRQQKPFVVDGKPYKIVTIEKKVTP